MLENTGVFVAQFVALFMLGQSAQGLPCLQGSKLKFEKVEGGQNV